MNMAAYREEEDPYEEDVVFDQAGLLSTSSKHNTAIRRVSSGKCGLFSKTLGLCGAFFGLGLSIAITGPTVLSPVGSFQLDQSPISSVYLARSVGYLAGALMGGFLFDRFNRLFLLFLSLLLMSGLVMIVPWCDVWWLLQACMVLLGTSLGFLDTGGNKLCLDLWGRNSGPFMQALHFSFGLGAFVAPLLAAPFLQSPSVPAPMENTMSTFTPSLIDVSNAAGGFLEANGSIGRSKREEWIPQVNGVTLGSVAGWVTSGPEAIRNISTSEVTSVGPRVPKPKPSKTDGSKLGTENWDKFHVGKPPLADLVPLSTSPPTPSVSPSQPAADSPHNTSLTNHTLEKSNVENVYPYEAESNVNIVYTISESAAVTVGSPETTPDTTQVYSQQTRTTLVDIVSSTVAADTNSVFAVSAGIGPSVNTGPDLDDEFSKGTSSSLQATEPVFTNKNDASEQDHVVDSSPLSSYVDVNTSEELDKMLSAVTPVVITVTTTIVTTVASDLETDQAPPLLQIPKHVHHFKPGTYDNDTEDVNTLFNIFANRTEIYGLTKIQFTYLIVGLFVFVISVVFLGFLCHNPRDPKSKQEESQGTKKVSTVKTSTTLVSLMAVFLMLYVGLEVTYGQLLVAFGANSSLLLSPSTSALLVATFWGTFAATRFAAILLSSALTPLCILLVSFFLCSLGTVLLSALADTSDTALWIGTVLVSVGLATVFPTSILWLERYVHVSNKVAAVFVMGVTLGEMVCPVVIYRLMQQHPMMLMHIALVVNIACVLMFAIVWRLAYRLGEKYVVVTSNGYQLARQNEEEDEDMIEMSPSRRRLTFRRHSFTSEHRSLLLGNLTRRP